MHRPTRRAYLPVVRSSNIAVYEARRRPAACRRVGLAQTRHAPAALDQDKVHAVYTVGARRTSGRPIGLPGTVSFSNIAASARLSYIPRAALLTRCPA